MDRPALRSLLTTVVVLALGCPGNDDASSDDAPEPTSSVSATDGTTTDPSATGQTATAGSTSATSTSATSTSATSTSATSTTEPTAGDSTGQAVDCGGMTCGEGEYCDWTTDSCGESPAGAGNCVPRPNACDDIYQPVCGCDGQVHGNECEAQTAGVDVSALGECETPKGYFACGYRFCDPAFTYCQVSISDVGGIGNGYSCVEPAECSPVACECLTMEPCFELSCEPTKDGGIEIVCPGG